MDTPQTEPTPGTSGALTIIEGLSTRLLSCLTYSTPEDGIKFIVESPNLLAEVRKNLPAIRNRALLPAASSQIRSLIMRRFETFPQPERAEHQWALFWSDYETALQGVPAVSIEAALKAWVSRPDSEFLPKPGKLRELAMTVETAMARAYFIGRKASELAEDRMAAHRNLPEKDRPQRSEREVKTVETKEAVKAMAADFTKSIADLPKVPTDRGGKILERERRSALYRSLMEQGLQQSRQSPPTVMQRIAATLDEKSQGRLAEGRAITPLMIEVLECQRSSPRPL